MQDSEGGREGAERGYATAWHIADQLGLKPVADEPGNIFLWNGEKCVIKTAAADTDQVKIPKKLYASLAGGIVAKDTGGGAYDLYRLDRAAFDRVLEPSKGKSAGTQWAFRLKRLLADLEPFQACRPIEYRVESYWPNADGREFYDEYSLWVHDGKIERVNSIPSGSKILFYETEKDSYGKKLGAMKIFASGTLTDRLTEEPEHGKDANGRVWREHRVVELDAWTKPSNGIPFDDLRTLLGRKKGWAMQTCPYPVPPFVFRELRERLASRSGVKSVKRGSVEDVPPRENPTSDYDSLALRSEEEQVRQRAASLVKTRAIHNRLTNAFKLWCETRWRITPKKSNFDALLEVGQSRILVEAKSTAVGGEGRQQIREAIGQLYDYAFEHWPKDSKSTVLAVLLPDAPPDYARQLLRALGIGLIWRVGDEFKADEIVSKHLPG